MHRETWLKTAFKGTDVFGFACGADAQGASHSCLGLATITRALLGLAVKPGFDTQNRWLSVRLRRAQVETLYFVKWMVLRNWFSVMFTALKIVFSCTVCILKPFIGVQCSLHKYKGKKSQQFRLLSYSAEIINGDRSTIFLKSA